MRLSMPDAHRRLARDERVRLERAIRLALGPSAAGVVAVRAHVALAAAPGARAPVWRCALTARCADGARIEVADAGIELEDAVRAAAWRLARRARRESAAGRARGGGRAARGAHAP